MNSDNHPQDDNQEHYKVFTKESSSGFIGNFTVSNDKIRSISKANLSLRKETIFRMPNLVANMFKQALSRKNQIIYCVSNQELSVDVKDAAGQVYLPLLTREEICKRLDQLDMKVRKTISMVHIGAVKILLKAQFRNGIDTPVKLALLDNRINNREDCILGAARGNLCYGKFMFTVYPKFGLSLTSINLNQVLSLVHEFSRKDLMNKGDKLMTVTYIVGYALTNSHHSIDYQDKPTIELDDVFQEIGDVQGSHFCDIQNDEEQWAIDIAKNKRVLGEKPKLQIKNNQVKIERSDDLELSQVNKNVENLKQQLNELLG